MTDEERIANIRRHHGPDACGTTDEACVLLTALDRALAERDAAVKHAEIVIKLQHDQMASIETARTLLLDWYFPRANDEWLRNRTADFLGLSRGE